MWALGYPKGASTGCLTATIGLPLCKDHAQAECEDKSIITDEFWSRLDDVVRSVGGMPADHSTLDLRPARGVDAGYTGPAPNESVH